MRVAFHALHEFHRAVLEPIYERLAGDLPALLTSDLEEAIAFAPRAVVLADQHYGAFRERLPGTIIVWVRHGFATKRHVGIAAAGCDFACLSSEWSRRDFERRGWIPRLGFWVTGFVPLDAVLGSTRSSPPLPREFAEGRKTLLYAPTYNPRLSSYEVLGADWIDRLHRRIPSLNVIVKPHPVTPERTPQWMETWRAAARRNPRTWLVEDAHGSVYSFFPLADVLLTDASSVAFYFLAMDRPIVLVKNARRCEDEEYFDPEGPEWTWRDMGVEVESADDLPSVIARCLEDPRAGAAARALYRERVLGEHADGRAAERVAARLRELAAPAGEAPEWARTAWHAAAAFGRLEQEMRAIEGARNRLLLEASRLADRVAELERAYRASRSEIEALLDTVPVRLSRRLDRFPRLKGALRRAFFARGRRGAA